MSTKTLLPDQCTVLHAQYGAHDCCLCKAREEVARLQLEFAQTQNDRHRAVEIAEQRDTLTQRAIAAAEALREALSHAKSTLKVVVDHIDTKAYQDLADRMVEAWDKCEEALCGDDKEDA